MAVSLRPCAEADLNALYRLDQACFAQGIAYSKAELAYYLRRPRCCSRAALERDSGRLLGFAVAECVGWKRELAGHIITIDVALEARRTGIGRLLLEALEAELKTMRASRVRLEVAIDNSAAQVFYQQMGYRQTGRIPGYYLGTLDAWTMEKQLGS